LILRKKLYKVLELSMYKKQIILILYFSLYNSNVYAYLDPGTGGIILQAIFGIIAGIITFYYLLKKKIKSFFIKIKNIIFRDKRK